MARLAAITIPVISKSKEVDGLQGERNDAGRDQAGIRHAKLRKGLIAHPRLQQQGLLFDLSRYWAVLKLGAWALSMGSQHGPATAVDGVRLWQWTEYDEYGCGPSTTSMAVDRVRRVWLWTEYDEYGCGPSTTSMAVDGVRRLWQWTEYDEYGCGPSTTSMAVDRCRLRPRQLSHAILGWALRWHSNSLPPPFAVAEWPALGLAKTQVEWNHGLHYQVESWPSLPSCHLALVPPSASSPAAASSLKAESSSNGRSDCQDCASFGNRNGQQRCQLTLCA
ncbi:hypothetical protein E2P81_ATG01961 [Venturia nashicola]|nr:hypothetical protein E2P81_ATG01961 [Venturia nashicola]